MNYGWAIIISIINLCILLFVECAVTYECIFNDGKIVLLGNFPLEMRVEDNHYEKILNNAYNMVDSPIYLPVAAIYCQCKIDSYRGPCMGGELRPCLFLIGHDWHGTINIKGWGNYGNNLRCIWILQVPQTVFELMYVCIFCMNTLL